MSMGRSRSKGIEQAYKQLQTYKQQIPALFHTNELLVISDGVLTEVDTITSGRERFATWKTIDGDALDHTGSLETAIRGIFEPRRFLDLIHHFIVFEDDGKSVVKKVAQYHQFHAVQNAVAIALQATGTNGDGKGGVLWHTQGSGKSLTMLFFAGKLVRQPALANPTIVMITDRTDLDGQLFGTFSRGADLLRQEPFQATRHAGTPALTPGDGHDRMRLVGDAHGRTGRRNRGDWVVIPPTWWCSTERASRLDAISRW